MLGKKKGDDYKDRTYLEGWEPIESRRWALVYFMEDGAEDYHGFVAEFKARHPRISQGPIDGWLPASVDDYVRHNEYGVRMDLDNELDSIPPTEEELKERQATRAALLRKRRKDALEDRAGRKTGMSAEAREKAAERMRNMHAARKADKAAAEAAEAQGM